MASIKNYWCCCCFCYRIYYGVCCLTCFTYSIKRYCYKSPILAASSENISTSINEIYTLGEDLSQGEINKNQANLETMNVLLKYKIVSPKTARELVVLDKLDGISGLEKVIDKYE